jgi:hypothetical protein
MLRKKVIFLGACALILAIVPAALAVAAIQAAPDAPASGFAIPWWTVDGGGKTSQGGPYTLSGSAGQPDAGAAAGGDYTLHSGFWGIKLQQSVIYLPVVAK